MAPALRARRIYFSPSVPAPPTATEPIESHSNILHLWNISKSPFFPLLLPHSLADIDGRQSSDCSRPPSSIRSAFYLPEHLTFAVGTQPWGTCLGR